MPALYTFTFGSDQHAQTSNFSAVCDGIVSSGGVGDFHISMGDFDMTGSDPYQSPEVNRAIIDSKFGADTIWYPVMSNHVAETSEDMVWMRDEYNNGQSGARTALKYFTNQDGPSGSKETQYTFDWGDVRFVVLNTYADSNFVNDAHTAAATITLGQIALTRFVFRKAVQQGKQLIVLGHEPMFCNGRHAETCLDRDKTTRDLFCQLMEDYGVLAYISGHEHNYSAYIPNSEVLPGDSTWDHEPIRPPDFSPNETLHLNDGTYGYNLYTWGFTYTRGEIWSDKVVFNIYTNPSADLVTWVEAAESPIILPFRSVTLPTLNFQPKIAILI